MKKIFTVIAVLSVAFASAQAFKGKGDLKGQVGLTLQDGGTGIGISTDFGMGENMSFGIVAGYMLNANEVADVKTRFEDRADLRVRFNANIGYVLKLDENMDVYPGLNLGLRNFGGHLGFSTSTITKTSKDYYFRIETREECERHVHQINEKKNLIDKIIMKESLKFLK